MSDAADPRPPHKAHITCALTGSARTTADNPALPVTPEQTAADAERAWRAGASIVHVHLRDDDERPSADLGLARQVVQMIRDRCPVVIELSTGVSFDTPSDSRAALLDADPDMASLSLCSMTFGGELFLNRLDDVRRMAETMIQQGIAPNVEIYDSGHLEVMLQLRTEGLLPDPLVVSLVAGVVGGMSTAPAPLVGLLSRLPDGCEWQLVDMTSSHWQTTALSLALGGHARTGLEDTNHGNGTRPPTNATLVARAADLAAAMRRPCADAQDVRSALSPPGQ